MGLKFQKNVSVIDVATPFHLRVAFLPIAPYISDLKKTGSVYQISGILHNIISTLSIIFKFSYELSMPPDKKFGSLLSNGSWNGLIGMLLRNEADMSLGVMGINELRSRYVRFADGYHMSSISILASKARDEPISFFAFLMTFDQMIWYLTSVLFLSLVIVSALCDKRDPRTKETVWHRMYLNSWLYLSSMFCEGSARDPPSRRSQLLLALWLVGVLVLSNCFFSQFKAVLMTDDDSGIMRTVEDLANTETKIPLIPSGSLFELVFQGSDLEEYRRIYRRALAKKEESLIHPYLMSTPFPYQKVKEGDYVFVCDEGTMKSYLSQFFSSLEGNNRLYILKETFFPFQHASAFRNDFSRSLLKRFNKRIMWMKEGGLVSFWLDQATRDFWKYEQKYESDEEISLGLTHLSPVFVLLAEMQVLCLIEFVIEFKFERIIDFVRNLINKFNSKST